jgi:hypothetical protein
MSTIRSTINRTRTIKVYMTKASATGINALKIQGVDVSATTPTGGQVLQYDSVDMRWEPTTIAASNLVFSKAGITVGTRPQLNLIEGSNVTLTVADNPGDNRVDVTIAATGGGGGGAVDSVNGQTGVVVLDTDDIAEGTNQYFTSERAQDAVGGILTDTATVDLVYNDGADTITANVIEAGLTLNNLGGTLDITKGGTNATSAANARTNLGLVIGTDVQAYDATLQSISALGTAADRIAYTTGVDTWAETVLTSYARGLIDDANAAAAQTTLGLVIGTNVQAYDADLAALAANTTNGFWTHTGSGTGAARTLTGGDYVTITNGDGVSGNPTFTTSTLNRLGGIGRQFFINGGHGVQTTVTSPTLSTTYQLGPVDRFYVKATGTAVSAGTIFGITDTSGLGTYLLVSGVTLTGSGVLYVRYRAEQSDVLQFQKESIAAGATDVGSASCVILHNTGSSKNATIYVRAANAANDFSGVTDISNSGSVSVPTGAYTTVPFENINLNAAGTYENGLEIEVQLAVGAVTTQDFVFKDFQMNVGSKVLHFSPHNYVYEAVACRRYRRDHTTSISSEAVAAVGAASSTTGGTAFIGVAEPMFKIPTATVTAGNFVATDGVTSTTLTAFSVSALSGFRTIALAFTVSSGLTQYRPYFIIGNGAAPDGLVLTAELT